MVPQTGMKLYFHFRYQKDQLLGWILNQSEALFQVVRSMDNEQCHFPFGHGALGAQHIIVHIFKVTKCMPHSNPGFIKCLLHAEVTWPGCSPQGPLLSWVAIENKDSC